MQDGTYLSRNSATLGPLTSQPPCVGRLTGRCRIQLDRLESSVGGTQCKRSVGGGVPFLPAVHGVGSSFSYRPAWHRLFRSRKRSHFPSSSRLHPRSPSIRLNLSWETKFRLSLRLRNFKVFPGFTKDFSFHVPPNLPLVEGNIKEAELP